MCVEIVSYFALSAVEMDWSVVLRTAIKREQVMIYTEEWVFVSSFSFYDWFSSNQIEFSSFIPYFLQLNLQSLVFLNLIQ